MGQRIRLGLRLGRACWALGLCGALAACASEGEDDPAEQSGTGDDTGADGPADESMGADGENGDGGSAGDGDADADGSGDGDADGPGDGSSGDDAADDAPADTGGPVECDSSGVLASEVVMIGDSYLAITSVPNALFVHARTAGLLGPMETYRTYYQGGTQMGNGQIPGQYTQAVNADPNIKAVIMTGGGNDVLIGAANSCLQNPPPGDATCVQQLDAVFTAAENLLQQMGADGVEQVVYFFYPHLPENAFPQGAKNAVLDYAAPRIQELCENASPVDCYFVDTRPAFEGQADYISGDGIHPSPAGGQVIADLVWETMQENCVAQ